MAQKDAGSSKRPLSRTPSPERRSRLKHEAQSPDASPAQPEDAAYLSDQFFAKLKPLKGLAPDNIGGVVVDHECDRAYGLEKQKTVDMSRLWCLHTNTMEWEHISILPHTTNIFDDVEDSLPYRRGGRLQLFGTKDRRRVLIFGGQDTNEKPTNDMFCVDLKSKVWSKVSIAGGSILPRAYVSCILVDEYKLFLFGGKSRDAPLKSFSLAVFDPSKRLWTWEILDRQLPQALLGFSSIMAVPIYDGKKFLIIGSSISEQDGFAVNLSNVFTFDPTMQIFDQDNHVSGTFPRFRGSILFPGSFENEAILCCHQDNHHVEVWSYRAFPDNKWKCLFELDSVLLTFGLILPITCMGKVYFLVADKREGKKGVNAFVEIE